MHEITWDNINSIKEPNEAYRRFLGFFSFMSESFFPKKRIRVKFKNLMNPWINTGISKFSSKKQRVYEKYLEQRTAELEEFYKS